MKCLLFVIVFLAGNIVNAYWPTKSVPDKVVSDEAIPKKKQKVQQKVQNEICAFDSTFEEQQKLESIPEVLSFLDNSGWSHKCKMDYMTMRHKRLRKEYREKIEREKLEKDQKEKEQKVPLTSEQWDSMTETQRTDHILNRIESLPLSIEGKIKAWGAFLDSYAKEEEREYRQRVLSSLETISGEIERRRMCKMGGIGCY